MTTLAFIMAKSDDAPGQSLQLVLAGHMVYAGVAIFLIGGLWAILRAIVFRKAKKRSFFPSAAMLLGASSFVVGMILVYVLA